MNKLEPLYNLYISKSRYMYGKRQLKIKLANTANLLPLSSMQKNEIFNFWKGINVDLDWFKVYQAYHNNEFDCRYIPDDVYYAYVMMYYNRPLKAKYIDDKNLYDLLFHDVRRPKTIIRKMSKGYLNELYQTISEQQALECCKNKLIIVKKSIETADGAGITLCDRFTEEQLKVVFEKYSEFIVQEVISQHPVMASLHEQSVNTIRFLTLFDNQEVKIVSSIVRMGVGDSVVDNTGVGGIFCGVKEDGTLRDVGYSTNGKIFNQHPQGAIFGEHKIPNYSLCQQMVKKIAPRMVGVGRLLSWDIAVEEDGLPVFIEANMSWGELDFHQMANGPLFGDMTKEIINEVFSNKTNRRLNKILNILVK